MGTGYNPRIVTENLVFCVDAANIRSYPKSGTTWSDLAGANDGTLTNAPAFNSDNGGGIFFDGTDDSVEFSALDSSLFSDGNASVFCFLKSQQTNNTTSGLWGFGSGARSHYIWSDGNIYLNTFRNSRPSFTASSSVDRFIPHVLCVTTKNGGSWKCYQNLELVHSTGAESSINLTNPRIGYGDTTGYRFRGVIYSFMIYNKELSFAEIRQNYLATKERYA